MKFNSIVVFFRNQNPPKEFTDCHFFMDPDETNFIVAPESDASNGTLFFQDAVSHIEMEGGQVDESERNVEGDTSVN